MSGEKPVYASCQQCGSERLKINMRNHPVVSDHDIVVCTNCGASFTFAELQALNAEVLRDLLQEHRDRDS
jgi:uncharacterized Zn finger protein